MQPVTIYTKLKCHLCEDAYKILFDVACDLQLRIDIVDIALPHNAPLKEKYLERIPVIVKPGIAEELAWPFTADDIKTYLVL